VSVKNGRCQCTGDVQDPSTLMQSVLDRTCTCTPRHSTEQVRRDDRDGAFGQPTVSPKSRRGAITQGDRDCQTEAANIALTRLSVVDGRR